MASSLEIDLNLHPGEDSAFEDDKLEDFKDKVKVKKGRGFGSNNYEREGLGKFDRLAATDEDASSGVHAKRSAEGWILIVTGVHDEAHEDDVQNMFADFGEISNLHLNLDRQTGYLKGYALVEFKHFKDASSARLELDGKELLGSTIHVDWAFMKNPTPTKRLSRRK